MMENQPHNRLNSTTHDVGTNGRHQADAIRQRMAEVRTELEEDVHQISKEVEKATHWEYYVKKFPFVCVGVAAMAGFCLVPSRKPQTITVTDEQIKKLAEQGKLHVVSDPPPQQRTTLPQKAMLAVGTVAARAAMAYVGKLLGENADTRS